MKTEKSSKKIIVAILAGLIISLLIKIASLYPLWIETNYSRGVYPYVAWIYRLILGWIPFSCGDILYLAAGIFLTIKAIKAVKILINRKYRYVNYKNALLKTLLGIVVIYVYFNIS